MHPMLDHKCCFCALDVLSTSFSVVEEDSVFSQKKFSFSGQWNPCGDFY